MLVLIFVIASFILFYFLLFRAALMAYGGSQARDPNGAVAAGLHHSHRNAGSQLVCDLHHNSQQCWILNPPREARDPTRNLMVPSQTRFHCATTGTPASFISSTISYVAVLYSVSDSSKICCLRGRGNSKYVFSVIC